MLVTSWSFFKIWNERVSIKIFIIQCARQFLYIISLSHICWCLSHLELIQVYIMTLVAPANHTLNVNEKIVWDAHSNVVLAKTFY